jgi:hypothetical protein
MVATEQDIEYGFIGKLQSLKYDTARTSPTAPPLRRTSVKSSRS